MVWSLKCDNGGLVRGLRPTQLLCLLCLWVNGSVKVKTLHFIFEVVWVKYPIPKNLRGQLRYSCNMGTRDRVMKLSRVNFSNRGLPKKEGELPIFSECH